jgi:hypothetical protein
MNDKASFAKVSYAQGTFYIDFSEKDKKKLTIYTADDQKGRMQPIATIPVMSRGDVIKFMNRYAAYIKALHYLKNIPHPVTWKIDFEEVAKNAKYETDYRQTRATKPKEEPKEPKWAAVPKKSYYSKIIK